MSNGELVRASGGVVLRDGNSSREVLVVHRPQYDDWSLPKGKVDPGEDDEEAAVREMVEETGVHGRLVAELSSDTYGISRGRTKHVRWWSMTLEGQDDREPDAEVDLVEWWPVDRAATELTYPHDRSLVTQAVNDAGSRIVMLVRHAHAGNRSAWTGDDFKRPLTELGKAESDAIVDLLAPWHVSTIVTSPAKRCRKTVKRLSRARDVKRVEHAAVTEGAPPSDTLAFIASLASGAVVCSHGDVIGNVISHYRDHEAMDGLPADWPKASTWVLTFDSNDLRAARFIPRPQPTSE